MATYGSFPGVQVTTEGGGISGVSVGGAETLVIFGPDSGSGSATVSDPERIGSRSEAGELFGSDSELATAMTDTLENGANIDYLYGVKVPVTSVSAESFGATSSGTLANAPVIEDTSSFSAIGGGTTQDVEFRYDSPPSGTPPSDTVYVNPFTGEWIGDSQADYEFTYDYAEWSTGLDAADSVVGEDETGIYAVLTEAESVVSTLSTKVDELRDDYKLVNGLAGAQPNDNSSESPAGARYDAQAYTNSIDNDSVFLAAPVRKQDSTETILGGIGGLMAGHAIDNPIYNDQLSGFDSLEESFTKTQADDMRGKHVIPVRDSGSIRVKDNLSTSEESDWERDFWRRRIVDRVILIGKQVGDNTVGQINDEQTRRTAETVLFSEMTELVNDRLLRPNDSGTNWYVDVYESSTDPDQVNIDIGITPYGIAKRIDETITVNT